MHARPKSQAFHRKSPEPCKLRYLKLRETHALLRDSEFFTDDELDVDDRRHMAGILSENISIGEERMTMLAATEAVAESMVRAIDGGNAALLNTPALLLARRS